MTIDEFVKAFADEFEDTPAEEFKADTEYKTLDEWDSLAVLSIISMVDEQLGKKVTGADLRACNTIEDLFNFANSK